MKSSTIRTFCRSRRSKPSAARKAAGLLPALRGFCGAVWAFCPVRAQYRPEGRRTAIKLYFRGLASGYEPEHVTHLFFPEAQLTRQWPCHRADAVAVLQNGRRLVCAVRQNGQCTVRLLQTPPGPAPRETESLICRTLFLLLRGITGICPPWGMLTGVRPVRLVRERRQPGESDDVFGARLQKTHFVSEEKFRLAVRTAANQTEALASNTPQSYSLYISIPFCPSRCSYCSFVSRATAGSGHLIEPYLECLGRELAGISALARRLGLRLETVYIGGGTPTAISAAQLRRLMQTVRDFFDVPSVREYTVEAGRPDCTTPEKLAVLKEYGATRISINPQTLSDEVLAAIGRRHTAQDVLDCFAAARRAGHGSINMDLIAGLPHDTPESFLHTLHGVLALGPENITVHTLTLKRASNLVIEHAPPDYGDAARMLRACALLTERGYEPYYLYRQKGTLQNLENTGYTKPGFACLYNIFIMEEVHTILSAGAGGSTKLVGPDGAIRRIFNYKYPSEYIERFDTVQARKQGVDDFYGKYRNLDPQTAG